MATIYKTYDLEGIKEDVSDIISNISPTKVPFQSAIGNEKIHNTLHEWQEDELRAVAVNAAVEGADPTDATVAATTMKNNRTQIFVESVKVSRTADTVSKYGRAKEMAYQMGKSGYAVKRDLEHAFVGNNNTLVAGDDNTARTMNGVQQQVYSGNVEYMGAATPLSEAVLLTAIQDCYDAGSDPTIIQVTPTNSLVVADFAKASGRYRTFENGTAGDKSIVNVVNLYVSPFGEQKVQLNRFLRASNTIIFDPEMWTKLTLTPWTREPLAKTGDATRQMIVGEFSLKHKNSKASAIVVDNAASGF